MRLLSDYHETSWTSNLMHSHDRSETDESLACLQSVVLRLAVKEALFRNNTSEVVSQKHIPKTRKRNSLRFILC